MIESPGARSLRLAVVTNIPAPYRVPVFDLVAATQGIELEVVYAARIEPDRHWDLPEAKHPHVFLKQRMLTRSGRFIHFNSDVWANLRRFDPDVVITTGFNPTHLVAYLYALLHRRHHVVMTDGTLSSEVGLSFVHRWVRRAVFSTSSAFIVASQGGRRLLRSYGVRDSLIHCSPLCANTSVSWARFEGDTSDIDLLFSGRLVAIKNLGFALRVARGVARRLGRQIRVAVLGKGPLEAALRAEAKGLEPEVEVIFAGHVRQADVPRWFQRARLFVFPTRWDPWGVVANEACLVGVPVLVSPHAGVADELIVDGINGRVLPLDETAWVAAASAILGDARLHTRLSAAARSSALPYSFQNAASGIVDAARQAISRTAPPPPRLSTFVRRQRVVCVQRRLTHYRVELFEAMRRQLGERGVEFVLAHGQAAPSELPKKDGGTVPWAIDVPGRYFLRENLVWQDLSRTLAGADLVIVPQENRLLYNLLLMSSKRPARLAFWGHGRNFQSTEPHGLKERFKQWTVGRVDWWFAYTELSTRFVAEQGFAPDRITTLDNAIDSSRLQSECRSISVDEIGRFRNEWNLGGGPVGLFIGSLYAEKRVGILLEAGAELARRVPGFHLVVVGDGPERSMVHQAAARYPWLRMLGVRHGHDKAVCLRAAHLILNPGLVGLGILDAFAAGVPLVTTDSNLHSPEIAYLRQGENGVMTADTVAAFAEAGISLLNDPAALERMGAQAAVDAGRYTLENMTRNFCEGIQSALKTRPH